MITFPIYSHYFIQLKRFNAKHALIKLSTRLDEYYFQHNTYENARLDLLNTPEYIDQYQLIISKTLVDDYQIRAKPIHNQATNDAVCGELILSASGEKNITGNGNVKDCW